MSVYFIRNTRTSAVKVGFSADPKQRLKKLQAMCEDELALVGTVAPPDGCSDIEAERRLHQRLKDHGEHLHGEWFRGHMVTVLSLLTPESPSRPAWIHYITWLGVYRDDPEVQAGMAWLKESGEEACHLTEFMSFMFDIYPMVGCRCGICPEDDEDDDDEATP